MTTAFYDLDMTRLGDEELVVLAKQCGFQPARDELIVRFHDRSDRLVWQRAARRCFTVADIEDAQQSAVFWLIEAIDRYDVSQIGRRGGCSFRSFAFRVLSMRLRDFAMGWRRRRYRQADSLDTIDRYPALHTSECLSEPEAIAERHELEQRLRSSLTRIDASAVRLWELIVSGMRLNRIARTLGISYEAARHRKRKLLRELTLALRESANGESP